MAQGDRSTEPPVDFERALQQLRREHERRSDNLNCVECHRCSRCTDCTFCHDSTGLVRCHYVSGSERGVECTHCWECQEMISCTHCRDCSRCLRSAYLERCHDCTDCYYCYGCVGLVGREYHILNEPYDRASYFEVTTRLSKARR